MVRFRNVCFTINNPLQEEVETCEALRDSELYRRDHHVRFIVFQHEHPVGGTRHIQGYIELSKQFRLTALRSLLGSRVHCECRRGTQAQAIAYCKKEESRVADAPRGEGGNAKKLEKDSVKAVAALLQQGIGVQELSTDYPVSFIMHGSKIRSYALKQKGQRHSAPEITIYYGKTGTGKSALAHRNFPDAYWPPWPKKGGWWWSDYEGQDEVILDEWRHQISLDEILRLFDRYPYTVQEKGSSMNMVSTKFVVTTNIHPQFWFPNVAPSTKAPLFRRLRDFATLFVFDDSSTWDHPVFHVEDADTAFVG